MQRQSAFAILGIVCVVALAAAALLQVPAKKNLLGTAAHLTTSCPSLDGAFLVIDSQWSHERLTPEEWKQRVEKMHRAGLRILIVQQTVNMYDGRIIASYPSSFIYEKQEDTGQIESLLTAADAQRMEVYLGLIRRPMWMESGNIWSWKWPWWWHHKNVARELVEAYGHHPSFTGFYVTQEPTLNYARNPDRNIAVQYFAELSKRLKTEFPDKQLAASPTFFARSSECKQVPEDAAINPFELEHILREFLRHTSFDLVLLQDKVGTELVALEELPSFVGAAKRAARAEGTEFMVVAEAFRYCEGCRRFCTAGEADFADQIRALSGHPIVAYTWTDIENLSLC